MQCQQETPQDLSSQVTMESELSVDFGEALPPIGYPSIWRRLPNTAFGIGMGLAGQSILWKTIGSSNLGGEDHAASNIGLFFWMASLLVTLAFSILYLRKYQNYPLLVQDELKDPSRVHFGNTIFLIPLMLNIGVPEKAANNLGIEDLYTGRLVVYSLCLASQLFATSSIYESWLFSKSKNIECSTPQFLLSIVGWFLLSVSGSSLDIKNVSGLALPTFCLGIGLMTYIMVVIAIFNGLHDSPKTKGSPALFLLIAPPAVGAVAWDMIDDSPVDFAFGSQMLFGWCLGLVLLLFRLGPQISQQPPSLGAYWAYVFPLAALATASVRFSTKDYNRSTIVVSAVSVVVSVVALAIVNARMWYHGYRVIQEKAAWNDPLLSWERLFAAGALVYPSSGWRK